MPPMLSNSCNDKLCNNTTITIPNLILLGKTKRKEVFKTLAVWQNCNAPLEFHDYRQDEQSILANNWKTPLGISEDHTPDTSKFHFHFNKPGWYYDAMIKSPKHRLVKGRFLGFADTSGDTLPYEILTKQKGKHDVILAHNLLKSRRKNFSKDNECVNNDLRYADFFLHSIVTTMDPDEVDATTNLPSRSGEETTIEQPELDNQN